jgi:hypothetical protein
MPVLPKSSKTAGPGQALGQAQGVMGEEKSGQASSELKDDKTRTTRKVRHKLPKGVKPGETREEDVSVHDDGFVCRAKVEGMKADLELEYGRFILLVS